MPPNTRRSPSSRATRRGLCTRWRVPPIRKRQLYAWKGKRNIAGRIIATIASFLGYSMAMYIVLAGELAASRSISFIEAATTRFITIIDYVFGGFFIDNILDVILVIIGLVCCFGVAGMDMNVKNNEGPELVKPLNV